jgi:hypothetical protein
VIRLLSFFIYHHFHLVAGFYLLFDLVHERVNKLKKSSFGNWGANMRLARAQQVSPSVWLEIATK